MNLTEIVCREFGVNDIEATKDIVKGLINGTTLITTKSGKKFILQEINSNVFKNVGGLMNNIALVTDHLKHRIESEHGDPDRETLSLLRTRESRNYVSVQYGDKTRYFRMYNFIDNASSYDQATPELLYQAGLGFGKFQRQLSDFPARVLCESIPNFHNTPVRYQQFKDTLNSSHLDTISMLRAKKAISYALENEKSASIIMDALNDKQIPLRVVHNDTKLNNVMFDDTTHTPVCVVDLDTIMPGSVLFDYGDAIRFSANTCTEDETVIQNVKLDMLRFNAFTDGFLRETAESLTLREIELLPYAPVVLSYELGLRFLTDYLNGNKYFRCDSQRPNHNLERAEVQFQLMENMKSHLPEMQQSVFHQYKKHLDHVSIK